MTVYVDSAKIPATVGRIRARWSHLTADERDELHTFAARIGLRRDWFQTCKNTRACPPETCPHWHYDVTEPKRDEALRLGAQLVDMRQLGALIAARRVAMRVATQTPAATHDNGMPVRPVLPPVVKHVCVICGAHAHLYPGGWLCKEHSPAGVRAVAEAAEAAGQQQEPWPVPAPPTRAYSPTRQQHSWTKFAEHNRVCGYCLAWIVNNTVDHHRWWQTWRWPDGRTGTNEDEKYPKMPKCPGPKEAE